LPPPLSTNPRVALVIDFFYWYGGAQKVEELILNIFPDADVFAGFKHPKYHGWLPKNVTYTIVHKFPLKRLLAPLYELFLPFAFERLDFSKYDVVISSTQCFAKGIIVPPGVKHISYVHTPPRFLWGMESSRQSKAFFMVKPILSIINHFLRIWDFHASTRPNILVTNSTEVQRRITKFYKRNSIVIHPPVDLPREKIIREKKDENLFVSVGRLVSYKKVDVAIEAFKKMPEKTLVIIGSGDEETRLRKLARGYKNIRILGFVDGNDKFKWIQKAKAVIHLPFEDFGIVPVEAMAMGTPVIGLNAGGTVETVINGKTGVLIDEVNVKNVVNAVNKIMGISISEDDCKKRAGEFSFENFRKQILEVMRDI